MKRIIGNWMILLMSCLMTSMVVSCASKLEKTIEQACEDGVITDTEMHSLDALFEKKGVTAGSEKWQVITEVCTGYGYDVPPVNPWDNPVPVDNRNILVNVYLDNTSSMAGYMKADDITRFVDVFSGIDAFYINESVGINAFLTQQDSRGKTEILQQDWEGLKSDLIHKRTKFTDSYQLDDFFKVITNKMVSDPSHKVINFFITDGIPSGTNEEVRGTRFNINSASILQTRITKAVNACDARKCAVSVYRFTADFKGDYYKYNNEKEKLNNKLRPFYVVVLGEKELVKQVADKAMDGVINFFKPQHAVHYGFTTSVLTPNLNVDSDYNPASHTFEIALDKDSEKKVSISFPVSQIPCYAREKDYLEANLSVCLNGGQIPFVVNKNEIVATAGLDRYASYEVRFQLKDALPGWIKNYTSRNDSAIGNELSKTFNLDILTEGLKCGVVKNSTNILLDEKFIINYDHQE